jgi:predicted acyltransferase
MAAGAVCAVLGLLLSKWFPVNKNLWSASFVLYTSGAAFMLLGISYLLIDIAGFIGVLKPFIALGSSAIFVYIVFELIARTLWLITIKDTASGLEIPLNLWLCSHIVTPWAGSIYDSLYFSLLYVLCWVILMSSLYRKNIIFKF